MSETSEMLEYIKRTWQTGETITAPKLNSMEDGIALAVALVNDAMGMVANLPLQVAEDGFTDLYDLRQLIGYKFVKNGSKITGTLTLQGDEPKTRTIEINLNANGFPAEIIVDGIDAAGTWEGFDNV